MTNQNDLPGRVAKLERQMKKCRVDATAARVLASAADRDVAEFRTANKGHTSVLNSLRQTQLEHDARFDQLEARMTEGFSTLAVGQAQITALLKFAIGRAEPT
jgi:hypothetical protein